jgi:hypothetical protein
VQLPPKGAQMPQLELQQYWPEPQKLEPQATPGPTQALLVHDAPDWHV